MIITLNVVMLSAHCWICTADATLPPSARRGGHSAETRYGSDVYGDESDLDAIKQLNSRLNMILGPDWLESVEKSKNADATNHTVRSKLADGFFNAHQNRAGGKRKIKGESRESTVATVTDVFGDLVTATAVVSHPERTVFGSENECESANRGRPCVCYMTDFLDSVCQQLDEAAAVPVGDDTATVYACPSYKVIPAMFVVSPATFGVSPAAADGVPATISRTADRAVHVAAYGGGHLGNRIAVTASAAWKQVDLEHVINYQLDKTNDGR